MRGLKLVNISLSIPIDVAYIIDYLTYTAILSGRVQDPFDVSRASNSNIAERSPFPAGSDKLRDRHPS